MGKFEAKRKVRIRQKVNDGMRRCDKKERRIKEYVREI